MTDRVTDNPAENRFELHVGGHIAATYYRKASGVITFVHTEVPEALGGQGIGSKLVRGALEAVRQQGLKVEAQCPFAAAFIKKHAEFADLLETARDKDKKHLDELLEEGLRESFPASDPPSVVDPTR